MAPTTMPVTEIYVWPLGFVTLYVIQIGDSPYALLIRVFPNGRYNYSVH
jgi:hypothetical protein